MRIQGSRRQQIAVPDGIARLVVIFCAAAVPCRKIPLETISRARGASYRRHCGIESCGSAIRAALSALPVKSNLYGFGHSRRRYDDISFYVSAVDRNLTVRSIVRITVRHLRSAYSDRYRGGQIVPAIGAQRYSGVRAESSRLIARIGNVGTIHRDVGFGVIIQSTRSARISY